MSQMKPCPFCGEREDLSVVVPRQYVTRAQCQACRAMGPECVSGGIGLLDATALWNGRMTWRLTDDTHVGEAVPRAGKP